MIYFARNNSPYIHFGFNRVEFVQKQVGVPVRVYVDGNFNSDSFSLNIIAPGATIVQETTRIFTLEYSTGGMKPITAEVTYLPTSTVITSNEITTEQTKFTFDSDVISFDNTIITFDNEQI